MEITNISFDYEPSVNYYGWDFQLSGWKITFYRGDISKVYRKVSNASWDRLKRAIKKSKDNTVLP